MRLYYQVTGNPEAAIAAQPRLRDVRSLALSCMIGCPTSGQQLEPKLRAAIVRRLTPSMGCAHEYLPRLCWKINRHLERVVKDWWRKQIAPALNIGAASVLRTRKSIR